MKYFAGDTTVPDLEGDEPRSLELRNVQRALAAMSLTSITFGPEFLGSPPLPSGVQFSKQSMH